VRLKGKVKPIEFRVNPKKNYSSKDFTLSEPFALRILILLMNQVFFIQTFVGKKLKMGFWPK